MDKQRIERWAKIAIGLVAAVLISPVVFLAVKGIVGLALALLVGSFCIAMAPVVAMKFANWRVKGIKAEAQENPIETLENLLVAKRAAFGTFREKVEKSVAARDNFKLKCDAFRAKYPARASEFDQQHARLANKVQEKIVALTNAQASIKKGEEKLEELRSWWDTSQALKEANEAAEMDIGDVYAQMKADTAVDAVISSVNESFAQLEVAAALNVNAPALENQPSQTVGLVGSLSESKVPR
jgi:hypothetical protein